MSEQLPNTTGKVARRSLLAIPALLAAQVPPKVAVPPRVVRKPVKVTITIQDQCLRGTQARVRRGQIVSWCTNDDQEYTVTLPKGVFSKAHVTVPAKGCSPEVSVLAKTPTGVKRYGISPMCPGPPGGKPSGTPTIMVEN